ncbi:MAG: hypothetical protein RL329_2956 [Bacteroidota bacterium]|jgi:hypothetical protein
MNFKNIAYISFTSLTFATSAIAQQAEEGYVIPQLNGFRVSCIITETGDTMPYIPLREYVVTAPKSFANADDLNRYQKYRRYAPSVYGYAAEAVRNYREIEAATRDVNRKDRKKYVEAKYEAMNTQFRSQLKNLTKTQGFLLIKMIEKELKIPFFDLVKDMKGGFTAFYWNEFGKVYGYHLKEGYLEGKDPILDVVLKDYNLAYPSAPVR